MTFQNSTLIVNAGSDLNNQVGPKAVDMFEAANHAPTEIYYVDPVSFDRVDTDIRTNKPDLILTYGGDGTANFGAELAIDTSAALLPLPGGTMNLLHKALYGSDDWETCLQTALDRDLVEYWSYGQANGQIFLVAAIFGHVGELQTTREAMREMKVTEAVENLGQTLMTAAVKPSLYFKDNPDAGFDAVTVTCPYISNVPNTETLLCSAVSEINPASLFDMACNSIVTDWRDSDRVVNQSDVHFNIQSDAPILALLDGERFELDRDVEIKLVADKLKILGANSV